MMALDGLGAAHIKIPKSSFRPSYITRFQEPAWFGAGEEAGGSEGILQPKDQGYKAVSGWF